MRSVGLLLVVHCLITAVSPAFAQLKLSGAPTNASYSSLVSSADGTKLLATEFDTGAIYTSTTNTGAPWRTNTLSFIGSTAGCSIVASSADLSKLMVAATNGLFISGDSGVTWTPSQKTSAQIFYSVAASADMTKLASIGVLRVPAGGGGWVLVPALFTSIDSGISWATDTNVPPGLGFLASSADGTKLVSGAPLAFVYVSQNSGATWTQTSLPGTYGLTSSADGSKLRSLWSDAVFASDDSGATWTVISQQIVVPFTPKMAASADGARLVVGGLSPNGPVYTTTDSGANWQATGPFYILNLVASADGTKLAAVHNRAIYTYQMPPLSTVVTAKPPRVQDDDEVTVVVSTRNNTTNSLTNVEVNGSITVAGTGGVSPAGFHGPTLVPTLASGATTTFTYLYRATNYGEVDFTAATTGTGPSGVVTSPQATSGIVSIAPKADLLIKTADPYDTTFVGGGEFQQPPPFNDQDQTLRVGTNGVAGYVVRLENDVATARTFVLRGATNSFTNWNVQVFSGTVNILDAMTSANGWTTPQLAPGADLDLQVSLAPMTGASVLENKSLLITVLADSSSSDVLDAVLLHAMLVPVPVQVTLLALTASGLTPDSIAAGINDINAPLVPVTDAPLLDKQPQIHGGLVADSVTPLVIKLAADSASLGQFATGLDFAFQASILGGGTLNGNSINQRMLLLQNGAWQPATDVVLTAASPNAYVQVQPIFSDDLMFTVQPPELDMDFSVTVNTDGVQAGDVRFALRKPPIALIHGYNTTGDWGDDFQTILGTSRPIGFVRTVKYGQDQLPELPSYFGVPVYVNTVAPLDECAELALESFNQMMSPLHSTWAFTRFDVVAHSQGGVLTRMLCNANPNSSISQPFRNADNFNRGRFHRVVTIGSPHNGSRLLRYLLDLNQEGKFLLVKSLPQLVGALGVLSDVAQAKFDPFGDQFALVNDPSPSAPWYPDVAAQFHLVRPTIDNGESPIPGDLTLAYLLLGLDSALGGASVIPRGSDGVVDFDSMAANVPPAPVGANVYTVPPANLISHAGPISLFGATAPETESTLVAQHVIDALDQNPLLPPADITFGSFSLPPTLDQSQRALIDDYASSSSLQLLTDAIVSLPQPLVVGSNYQYQLVFPANLPPQGNVAWFVQVFGPRGITTDGVAVSSQGSNNSQVTITVDGAVVGDVVLSGAYVSVSNTVVATTATLVVSLPPSGVTLTGIQVLPGTIALPIGSTVSPQVVANYSDGSSSLRYVKTDAVAVLSSQPSVVSVTDPLNWQLSSVGTAKVSLTWSGFQVMSQITVFDPGTNTAPALSLVNAGNGQMTLSWPGFTTSYVPENTGDLGQTNSWQPVLTTPIRAGGQSFLALAVTNAQQFYRLRWQP